MRTCPTLSSRDLKLKTTIVQRLDETERSMKAECKERLEHEKDLRAHVDAETAQLRVYMDESTDTVRSLVGNDQEKLRGRIQEVSDSVNSIELELAALRTEVAEGANAASADKEGREKVLEAKIEDLSDRLRLGMNKLQTAIGESRGGGGGGGGGATGTTVSLEEAEAMYAEDIEGVKEKMAVQVREGRSD